MLLFDLALRTTSDLHGLSRSDDPAPRQNIGLCKLINGISIGAQQLGRPPAGSAT